MLDFRSASAAALRKHSRGRPIQTPRGNAAYSNERPFLRMKSASLAYASERSPATALRLKASAQDSRNRRGGPAAAAPSLTRHHTPCLQPPVPPHTPHTHRLSP